MIDRLTSQLAALCPGPSRGRTRLAHARSLGRSTLAIAPAIALAIGALAALGAARPVAASPARPPAVAGGQVTAAPASAPAPAPTADAVEDVAAPAPDARDSDDTADAGGAPWTPAKARRLLRPPPGSLSIGATSSGRLEHGRAIVAGKAWSFMPHIPARGTTWGVDEMQGFLDRIGAGVSGCRKGAELRVGNISLVRGGFSPWHRSHQAGRDVDLAPMLVDRKGRSTPLDDFVRIDRSGRARDGSGRKLDARCTLQLLVAIASETETPAQWVFLSRTIKALALREAAKAKVDAAIVERIEAMVKQPSDSAPHDDHLHVRLFCSEADRRYGCLDREPWRPWVKRDDAGFARHVQQVAAIARATEAATRREAIALLGRLRTPLAIPALGAALVDKDAAVRKSALEGLVALGDASAAETMLRALGEVDDDVFAVRLYDVARKLRAASLLLTARALLVNPAVALQPMVRDRAGEALALRAIATLRGDGTSRPDPAAVESLLSVVRTGSAAMRRAAHDALLHMTNQAIPGDPGGQDPASVAAAWTAFWQKHSRSPWGTWVAEGFADHGVPLAEPGKLGRSDVPALIDALGHRSPAVVHNATLALAVVVGEAPKAQPGAATVAAWRRWWQRHRREYKRPAAKGKVAGKAGAKGGGKGAGRGAGRGAGKGAPKRGSKRSTR